MLNFPFESKQRPWLKTVVNLLALFMVLYSRNFLLQIVAIYPFSSANLIINLAVGLIIALIIFYIVAGFFEKMVLTENELVSVHNFRKRIIKISNITKITYRHRALTGGRSVGDPIAEYILYDNLNSLIKIDVPQVGNSREKKDGVAIIKYLLQKNPAIEADEEVRTSLY